ncbi:MAG TPA: hypothetical protein VJ842_20235 [Pyrinomonadaceae bacterium]|nr:hypothetical protein [Pyrinomonadaceae bacterium]
MMRVEPSHIDKRYRLKLPPMFTYANAIKVSICLTPVIVLHKGYDLSNNLFFTSLSLTTLIAPLTIPSSVKPKPEDTASLSLFIVKWLLAKLDTFVKSGILLLVLWAISKLPFIPDENSTQATLESLFRFRQNVPIEKHLVLPTSFYIFALLMLIIRTMMLFGGRYILGYLSGCAALLYFYNLTFKIALTSGNWKAPASGGALVALGWSCFTAYQMARVELVSKEMSKPTKT